MEKDPEISDDEKASKEDQGEEIEQPVLNKINGSNDLFETLPKVEGLLDPGKIPEPEIQAMNQQVLSSLTEKDLAAIIRTLESNDYVCDGKVCINDTLFANTNSGKSNTITIDLQKMEMRGTYYYGAEPEVMEHFYDLKTGQGALVNITKKLYCVSNKAKETMSCYDADSDSNIPVLDDGLAAQYEQEIDRQLRRFF